MEKKVDFDLLECLRKAKERLINGDWREALEWIEEAEVKARSIHVCDNYSDVYRVQKCHNAITMIQLVSEFPFDDAELELIIETCKAKMKR